MGIRKDGETRLFYCLLFAPAEQDCDSQPHTEPYKQVLKQSDCSYGIHSVTP